MPDSLPLITLGRHSGQEPLAVSAIIARIDDRYGLLQVENGRFERECTELLQLIDEARVAQGYIPYDDNERIIVVRELYRVMEKFRGRNRRAGGSYFFEHLMGACKILVRDIGLNGLSSIIAEANHDTPEDLIDEGAIESSVTEALAAREIETGRGNTDAEIGQITLVTRRKALAAQRKALLDDLVDYSGYRDLIEGFDEEIA